MSNPAFSDHPNYLSTACHHGLHMRCRRACEFCGTLCVCECHVKQNSPAEVEKREREQREEHLKEMERQNAIARSLLEGASQN